MSVPVMTQQNLTHVFTQQQNSSVMINNNNNISSTNNNNKGESRKNSSNSSKSHKKRPPASDERYRNVVHIFNIFRRICVVNICIFFVLNLNYPCAIIYYYTIKSAFPKIRLD